MSMLEDTNNKLTEVENNGEQTEEIERKEKVTLSSLKNKISSAFEGDTVKEKSIDAAGKAAKTVGLSAVTIATEIVEGTAATFNITGAQEKLYQKRNDGWNKVRGIWGKEEKEHDRLDGAEIRKGIKNAAMAVVRGAMERANQQMAEQEPNCEDGDNSQKVSYQHKYSNSPSLAELNLDVARLEIEAKMEAELKALDIE